MGRADNAGSSPNCRTLGILKRMIYGPLQEIRNEDSKFFHEGVGNTTIFDAPPPRYPDDSFSNGFLTHRIPSRDNVDDSSRASCVHKGKVARIDRLFRRPLLRVNIILISAEIWNGVERCGCGCTNWRNRNPHFQRSPDFPTLRFSANLSKFPHFSKDRKLNI